MFYHSCGGSAYVDIQNHVTIIGSIGIGAGVLTLGTIFIEMKPVVGRVTPKFLCKDCGKSFEREDLFVRCCRCGDFLPFEAAYFASDEGVVTYCMKHAEEEADGGKIYRLSEQIRGMKL